MRWRPLFSLRAAKAACGAVHGSAGLQRLTPASVRADNLLHLACTLMSAHSAAVAAPARAAGACALDGLALLGACADACEPCGVVAVDNPGRDGR